MKTLVKRPSGMQSSLSPFWRPSFFRSSLMDLWDDDFPTMTVPSINVREDKNNYRVEMAAPGLRKEDFKIEVDRNMVTVSCEQESKTEDEGRYSRSEYNYSSFTRSFSVPDYADAEKISAKYTDGILQLSMPKKADAKKDSVRSIKVE